MYGAVESDFFVQWVIEIDGGEAFILNARQAADAVRQVERRISGAVLILYENFIGAGLHLQTARGTAIRPTGLLKRSYPRTIREPLATATSPGPGLAVPARFLFHAVRSYMLCAAESQGQPVEKKLLIGVTRHVVGMDLHPVVVTLARVTYLLAIGRARSFNPTPTGTSRYPFTSATPSSGVSRTWTFGQSRESGDTYSMTSAIWFRLGTRLS